MKKTDLIVYRDKIKKLHKAAVALRDAHGELETHQEKMLGDDFDPTDDWGKLTKFMTDNPDLGDKLKVIEGIIEELTD